MGYDEPMSKRNSLVNKAKRRAARANRPNHTPGRLYVPKGMVLGHRYLAAHGLNFSLNVAKAKV